MQSFEHNLLALYSKILTQGEKRPDRTGTGVFSLFGERLEISLSQGFPIVTTKAVPFKAVLSELLWFCEGSGDERRLAEILHGTRDPSKKTIWSPNAAGTTGAKYVPKFQGDLGRVYGVQWRSWQSPNGQTVDQLKNLVHTLKTNPRDRRMVMTAWNPGELDEMTLPPCHMFSQFYLSEDNKLSCQMYQRSVDSFLGLPFNISSYALLTHMIAASIGADVGKLIMVLGDTHIYLNHVQQVQEQLKRSPKFLPKLNIQPREIDQYTMADFELIGYNPDPAIKGEMAA